MRAACAKLPNGAIMTPEQFKPFNKRAKRYALAVLTTFAIVLSMYVFLQVTQ
jgi:hypothetical protein